MATVHARLIVDHCGMAFFSTLSNVGLAVWRLCINDIQFTGSRREDAADRPQYARVRAGTGVSSTVLRGTGSYDHAAVCTGAIAEQRSPSGCTYRDPEPRKLSEAGQQGPPRTGDASLLRRV